MPENSNDLRQRLLDKQEMSPALRASYSEEVANLLHPKPTLRSSLPGMALLAILVVCVAGIVRNMIIADPKPLVLVAWSVLAVTFSWVAFIIVRDVRRGTHSRKSQHSIASILTLAGGSITVVSLLQGLSAPADPASTFNAIFVFVFYFACVAWALESRIAAAELAAREQMLRIEYRLADVAERLQANGR